MSDPTAENKPQAFIFLDPGGKRWPRLRIGMLLSGILLFAGFVWFVESLFVKPQLQLPASVQSIKGKLKGLQQKFVPPVQPEPWVKYYPASTEARERLAKLRAQF